MSENVVLTYKKGKFQHEAQAGNHIWIVDEPQSMGGDDEGPSPYDMILAALGACTSMTIMMYARQKGWPLEDLSVELSHDRIYAKDCQDCETNEGQVDEIHRKITLMGPLSDEQIERLTKVGERCPVHRALVGEIKVRDEVVHTEAKLKR